MHDLGSCKVPEFLGAPEAAKLLQRVSSTITRQCESGKFEGAIKARVNGIDAWQIPVASLPAPAQRKLHAEILKAQAAHLAATLPTIAAPAPVKPAGVEAGVMWDAFERSPADQKRRAQDAFEALSFFHDLVASGRTIGEAEKAVASEFGVSKATLWRYRTVTDGQPKLNWLPLLRPRYKGGRPWADFTPAAYEYIRAKFLNTSETSLAVVLEDARTVAPGKGWLIPSYHAVQYRLEKEPAWLMTVGRKGPKALEQSYPSVERDYTSLALHELWESDGRKADVVCRWPDGSIARPFIIAWREVRSRLVLGVKGYLNPSADGVLAAFGMALERAGCAPDFAKIDNGREYAAKSVSGGQANRYRFKVMPGEQPGIMTLVGTKAEWSKPGRGQDKPIESGWRFYADRCDKAPEFQGAYCGRNPVAKPEDFDREKAIPIALYEQKLAAVLEYFNMQHRHTGSGMDGRTPMEVYTTLSAENPRPPVQAAHLRLCKMGSAQIKPDKKETTYTLQIPGYGRCRYWSEKIASSPLEVLSRKHNVYYELEDPKRPVAIYDGEKWLDDARLIEAIDFREQGGASSAAHVAAKNAFMKPKKAALKAIGEAGQLDQPSLPGVTSLTPLPSPIHAVTCEGKRIAAPAPVTEIEDLLIPTGNPAEWRHRDTGKISQGRTAAVPQATATTQEDEERLSAMARKIQAEKDKARPHMRLMNC
jgi:putative transposase